MQTPIAVMRRKSLSTPLPFGLRHGSGGQFPWAIGKKAPPPTSHANNFQPNKRPQCGKAPRPPTAAGLERSLAAVRVSKSRGASLFLISGAFDAGRLQKARQREPAAVVVHSANAVRHVEKVTAISQATLANRPSPERAQKRRPRAAKLKSRRVGGVTLPGAGGWSAPVVNGRS